MRKFLLAASIAALCATPAFAGDDVMANTYGNTVVSTGGMREIHTHYRADHSFDMVGSMLGMSQDVQGDLGAGRQGQSLPHLRRRCAVGHGEPALHADRRAQDRRHLDDDHQRRDPHRHAQARHSIEVIAAARFRLDFPAGSSYFVLEKNFRFGGRKCGSRGREGVP